MPVTPRDRAAYEEERLAGASEDDRQAEADKLASIEYPEHMPPFSGLLADDGGHLWVREGAAAADRTQGWHVFGPDGGRRGHVRLSTDFRLKAVQGNMIFGVHEDEAGREVVRAYRFARD